MKSIFHVLLISLLALHPSLFAATEAMSLTTIDGDATTLALEIKEPSTLVLIAFDDDDLREAQRILTIPTKDLGYHTIVLIALPSEKPLKEKLIRHLAKDFFRSDFSRQRIFLTKADTLEYPKAKALIYVPGEAQPIHEYETYPEG